MFYPKEKNVWAFYVILQRPKSTITVSSSSSFEIFRESPEPVSQRLQMLIRCVAKTRFITTTGVARLVSTLGDGSDTSSIAHRNSLKEILRKNGPRRSVTSLLQERIDSGHTVALSELRFISKRLIRSNRYDLALQVWKFSLN